MESNEPQSNTMTTPPREEEPVETPALNPAPVSTANKTRRAKCPDGTWFVKSKNECVPKRLILQRRTRRKKQKEAVAAAVADVPTSNDSSTVNPSPQESQEDSSENNQSENVVEEEDGLDNENIKDESFIDNILPAKMVNYIRGNSDSSENAEDIGEKTSDMQEDMPKEEEYLKNENENPDPEKVENAKEESIQNENLEEMHKVEESPEMPKEDGISENVEGEKIEESPEMPKDDSLKNENENPDPEKVENVKEESIQNENLEEMPKVEESPEMPKEDDSLKNENENPDPEKVEESSEMPKEDEENKGLIQNILKKMGLTTKDDNKSEENVEESPEMPKEEESLKNENENPDPEKIENAKEESIQNENLEEMPKEDELSEKENEEEGEKEEESSETPKEDESFMEKIVPTGVMNFFKGKKDSEEEDDKETLANDDSSDDDDDDETESDDDETESDEDDNTESDDSMTLLKTKEDENKEQFETERKRHTSLKKAIDKETFLYPQIDDPNFNIKVAAKEEFKQHQYDGTIAKNIKEKSQEACESEFEILPHQQFVRNFMSIETPYNSLLLFHELGTGKTCSAIGIAEETRRYMRQTGSTRKILIIASPNVQDNFRLQLFDPSKLVSVNKNWVLNTCIGNELLREINPGNVEGISKEEVIRRIRKLIKQYYIFTGYESIESGMNNSKNKTQQPTIEKMAKRFTPDILDLKPISDTDSPTLVESKEKAINRIRKIFDDRLIIVDEAQNALARQDSVEDQTKGLVKQSAKILKQIARFCKHTRFLLLSATPVYNQPEEIVSLVNLLNSNDNRAQVSRNQILDKHGNFKPEQRNSDNQVIVESGQELLKRKLIGYVSYVRGENPYTFPYRLYPNDFAPKENQWLSYSYPSTMLNGVAIDQSPSKYVIDNVFVSPLGEYQSEVYNKFVERKVEEHKLEKKKTFNFNVLDTLNQVLNMSYPTGNTETIGSIKSCMNYQIEANMGRIHNFTYKSWVLENHGRIFHESKIKEFSHKIHAIIEAIKKSTGMVLVYSRYIEGGLVPLALALEELGLNRYCYSDHVTNFMKEKATEPFTVNTKTNEKYIGNYAMITGSSKFSPSNKKDLEMIVNKENSDGRHVKVVLISEAGSEGIDFKYIRQVHIMDPWYNMSRLEQIIGRSVRNKSHCLLPFNERNVEIYMHGTMNQKTNHETSDMYMYRFAEEKAIQIGQITRVLKEVAVDCLLNIQQQNFNEENMNEEITITTSSGKKIKHRVGDKQYSSKCDYMEKCEYQCSPSLPKKTPTLDALPSEQSTYNTYHLQRNQEMITKRIRQLFREKIFYKRSELIREIQIGKPYKIQEIYYILGLFLRNKLWVIHEGKSGYLVRNKDVYSFQLSNVTDMRSSLYDRTKPNEQIPSSIPLQVDTVEYENMAMELIPKPVIKRMKKTDSLPKNMGANALLKQNKNEKKTAKKGFLNDVVVPDSIKSLLKNNNKTEANDEEPSLTTKVREYKEIRDLIEKVIKEISSGNTIDKNESAVIQNGKVVYYLWTKDIDKDKNQLFYYICEHILDLMVYGEKYNCILQLFKTEADFSRPTVTTYTTIDEVIYSYFRKRIVEENNHRGIVLTNKTSNRVLYWTGKEWVPSENAVVQVKSLENAIHKTFWKGLTVKNKVIQDKKDKETRSVIGYIAFDSTKSQTYDFKLRDMYIERIGERTGVFCRFKQVVSDFLNPLLKQMKYNISYDKTTKMPNKATIEKTNYCFMYEILLRHLTRIKKEYTFYLSPEESIYTEIQNLAVNKETLDWSSKTKAINSLNEKIRGIPSP